MPLLFDALVFLVPVNKKILGIIPGEGWKSTIAPGDFRHGERTKLIDSLYRNGRSFIIASHKTEKRGAHLHIVWYHPSNDAGRVARWYRSIGRGRLGPRCTRSLRCFQCQREYLRQSGEQRQILSSFHGDRESKYSVRYI